MFEMRSKTFRLNMHIDSYLLLLLHFKFSATASTRPLALMAVWVDKRSANNNSKNKKKKTAFLCVIEKSTTLKLFIIGNKQENV